MPPLRRNAGDPSPGSFLLFRPWRRAAIRLRRRALPLYWRRVPAGVREVVARLEGAGHQAWLVGGCVRDLLLGRRPPDWDVATDALPEQVMRLFPGSHGRGAFGTVAVARSVAGTAAVEVTTFRTEETYSDRRRPDRVTFVGSLAEDLSRRDFTCNALALGQGGRLADPYGGLAALLTGEIRTVGDPGQRFGEDALRLMRAVRFAAQLGFAIHPETGAALQAGAPLLRHISVERIRDELMKILLAPGVARGLALLEETGLLAVACPELVPVLAEEGDPMGRAVGAAPRELTVRLALLLHPLPRKEAGRFLRRLRFPHRFVEAVVPVAAALPAFGTVPRGREAEMRRVLARAGRAGILFLIWAYRALRRGRGRLDRDDRWRISTARRILCRGDALAVDELAVSGLDVMTATGLPAGPRVGDLLKHLLAEVLADPRLNRRAYLLERARALAAGAGGAGNNGAGNGDGETNE